MKRECHTFDVHALAPTERWFSVEGCERIEDWDKFDESQRSSQQESCVIDGIELRRDSFEGGTMSTGATASGSTLGASWRSESPKVAHKLVFSGLKAGIACDNGARRFYVAHPFTGELLAYTVDGHLLWRRGLPDFRPLVDLDSAPTKLDLLAAEDAFSSGRSLAGGIAVSPPFIVYDWRRGDRRFHAVYHRSGKLIGVIGPWRGSSLLSPAPGQLRFTSSPPGPGWPSPEEEVFIRLEDHATEQLVRHFIAWSLPLRPATKLSTFKVCDALPADTIRWRLGSDFDAAMSERAKAIHDRLGARWFVRTLTRAQGALARLVAEGDPSSATWEQDLERAALAAGIDADFESALEAGATAE